MPADRFNPSTRADTSCFSSYRNLPFFDRIYAIHHARGFEWLRSKIAGLGKKALSVIELGCHDARSVEYISVPIRRYLGLGAVDGRMARHTASRPLRFAFGIARISSFAVPNIVKTSSAYRGNSTPLSFLRRSNISNLPGSKPMCLLFRRN
jgi:hypothetical protein